MILVRDIFHLKFGKAKDAKVLLAEGEKINKEFGFDNTRVLTDLTGPSYTLVLESTWDSLAAWEGAMKEGLGADKWQKWYQEFIPLVDSANREIFSVVL